jgi:hypothetical protein
MHLKLASLLLVQVVVHLKLATAALRAAWGVASAAPRAAGVQRVSSPLDGGATSVHKGSTSVVVLL